MTTGKPKTTMTALQSLEQALETGEVEASTTIPSVVEAAKVLGVGRKWVMDRAWLHQPILEKELTNGGMADRLRADLADDTPSVLRILEAAEKRARSEGMSEVQGELDAKDQRLKDLEKAHLAEGVRRELERHAENLEAELEAAKADNAGLRKENDGLLERNKALGVALIGAQTGAAALAQAGT